MIAGRFRQQRRNAIVASESNFNNAGAAFGGLGKGPALFAVPIPERAPSSFSEILCGYLKDGIAGSSGVILHVYSPEPEAISGARTVNVSLEQVIVRTSGDSGTGEDVYVSSAVDGGKLFSFPSDVFRDAMRSVDAELGYQLASHSNLRLLGGGTSDAAFSIKIVSSSADSLELSTVGLLAVVLLAPGIFASIQGSAFGASSEQDQVNHPQTAALDLPGVVSAVQPVGRRSHTFARTPTTAPWRDMVLSRFSSMELQLQAAAFLDGALARFNRSPRRTPMKRHAIILFVLLGLSLSGARLAKAQEASATAAHVATAIVAAPDATPSVPRLVQFNGTLKDSAARPVVGVSSVTFAIYAEQDGGTALWSETQNVIADSNGHFSALLGGAMPNGMPAELFGTGQSRWLGITIARSAEMPRVLLASVPYALKAGDANTLGGLPASAYVTAQALAASNARTTAPVTGGGDTTVIATPQVASASPAATTQSTSPQITEGSGGTADFIPIWTSGTVQGNSTIFESAGLVGIGTTTPAETLDVNGNSIFRGSFQLPPGHPATASSGYESHSFQFEAASYNSTTKLSDTEAFGFRAEPLGNNTSSPSAKLDLFYGLGGATLTDTGLSFAKNGIVTFAPGQSFSGTTESLSGGLNLPNGSSGSLIVTMGGFSILSNDGDIDSIFLGRDAGGQHGGQSGLYNTGIGVIALSANTSGTQNVAVGADALSGNVSGSDNSAVGSSAMASNATGSGNAAFGFFSLEQLSSGGQNSAFGSESLVATTGSYNTAIGGNSGGGNTSGSSNTFLGFGTNPSGVGLTNATAIGANSVVGASNSMVLGSIKGVNNATSSVNVGIGTTTPRSALELSAAGGDTTLPSPILTLTNTVGVDSGQVAIDFNTYGPSTSGTYNPAARITALDDNNYSDSIIFLANGSGGRNSGLVETMSIDPAGNVLITGDLHVNGTLSKNGGSFKIDDPIAPAEKYLSHSFVESPDMMNIYNGNVTTDAKGEASISMPAWFEALNGDFRYQLTVIGQFAQAIVASEIKDGTFTIRTDKPNVKVSWMVTGVRHDSWANAHRIPTEEEKPANEQGHYLHPELFGAGPDKAIAGAHHAAPVGGPGTPAGRAAPGSK